MRSFKENEKVTRVSNAVGTGQGTTNCTGVDNKDFDSITYLAMLGTIDPTGVVTLKVQQSSDDGSSDAYADIAGASAVAGAADDNKILAIEIYRPRERWTRAVIVRTVADSVIDGALAIQRDPKEIPVTQSASIIEFDLLGGPAEA